MSLYCFLNFAFVFDFLKKFKSIKPNFILILDGQKYDKQLAIESKLTSQKKLQRYCL